jgi:hypothetical protein
MSITLTREEAQQVLDALEGVKDMAWDSDTVAGRKLIETFRARLAQPEPKPVAWMYEFGTDNADAVNEIRWYKNVHLTKPSGMVRNVVPLYTAPPQRDWQGLTDEDRYKFAAAQYGWEDLLIAAEAKLKQKNA